MIGYLKEPETRKELGDKKITFTISCKEFCKLIADMESMNSAAGASLLCYTVLAGTSPYQTHYMNDKDLKTLNEYIHSLE